MIIATTRSSGRDAAATSGLLLVTPKLPLSTWFATTRLASDTYHGLYDGPYQDGIEYIAINGVNERREIKKDLRS